MNTLQDHVCHNEDRIRSLENDRSESRVYIKQINENIQEIRTDVRGLKQGPSSLPDNKETFKQTLIMELLKLITTLILMLGAVFGVIKILGE